MMRRILRVGALLAAPLLALTFQPPKADAASLLMCAPAQTAGTQARRFVNPNTSNAYVLNSLGCAPMRNDDATYAQSQGFFQGPNTFNIVFTQQTTGFTFTLPLSSYIMSIIGHEGTGNATSSGICIGSTTYGTSDVATLVGTGSTLKAITDASMAKRVFSTTASQAIYVDSCADTGFGTSIWDFTIEYGYF